MNHTLILLRLLICICLSVPLLSVAADKDKTREVDKLKEKPVETLSLQSLTTIYVSCINQAATTAIADRKPSLSNGDIQNSCIEERKNLKLKASSQYINNIDELVVTKYAEVATLRASEPSETKTQ